MKKKYLFCTKIWFFITEIPLAVILVLTCLKNFGDDNVSRWRFIPLIVVLLLFMAFLFIYFFRTISISYEEIRYHGLFSSKDSAIINKDKTLILTLCSGAKLKVELYGNDGLPPMFAGLEKDDYIDIYLFRGRAVGGRRTAARVLAYFELNTDDIQNLLTSDSYSLENDNFIVKAEKKEDIREIRMKFKQTL